MRGTEPAQVWDQNLCQLATSFSQQTLLLLMLYSVRGHFFISHSSSFMCWIQLNFPLLRSEEGYAQAKTCSQSRNGQGLALGSLNHEFPQRMTSICSILLYFSMLIRKVSMGVTHPGNRQWLPVCGKDIDRFSNIGLVLEERWKNDIFKSPRKLLSLYCNLVTKGNFSSFS